MIKEGFSESLAFKLRYEWCESGHWIFWDGGGRVFQAEGESKYLRKQVPKPLRWEWRRVEENEAYKGQDLGLS